MPFKVLYKIRKELRFNVYILSGKNRFTDSTIKVLYIISCEIPPYFINRFYKDAPHISRIKISYVWRLKKIISDRFPDVDFVMADMHKFLTHFFKIKNSFLVPIFIKQALALNKPKHEIIKGFRKNTRHTDLRKIRKFKYTYEISSDLSALKFFYERMYSPYIRKRYVEEAAVNDFDEIKKIFKNGEILFIKSDDKYISAVLAERKNGHYFWHRVGVLDGNHDFVKKGALSATYYFAILRAKELNAQVIDFGHSRPYLSDGVLRHKRKWNAYIFQAQDIQRLIYMKINKTKNAADVFSEQPFLCIENGNLKAVKFLNHDVKIADFDVKKFIDQYGAPGIAGFKIVDMDREMEFVNEGV